MQNSILKKAKVPEEILYASISQETKTTLKINSRIPYSQHLYIHNILLTYCDNWNLKLLNCWFIFKINIRDYLIWKFPWLCLPILKFNSSLFMFNGFIFI